MKNILLLVFLSTFGFSAQNTYNCTFTSYATIKGSFKKDGMKFKIITDNNKNTFTIKRSNSSTQGKIIKGEQGLSFAEVSDKGNITITTMTLIPPLENEQKAVHSQNVLAGGKILASQHYGTCQYVDPSETKKRHISVSKLRRHEIYQKLNLEASVNTLSRKDKKYVFDALSGTFPSKQEMEEDMSIEGMILVSKIMKEVMRAE